MKHTFKRVGTAALALTLLLSGCSQTAGQTSDQEAGEGTGNSDTQALSLVTDIPTTQYFTDEAVKEEDVTTILTAGVNAPSAMNGQPWHFTAITDIAHYFEEELGYIIPPMTPFVGRAFNATRAGIHADGMLKDPEIYNIFDTAKILGRPARVSINNASGLAGIAYWINDYYDLPDGHKIDKKDDMVLKLKEQIDAEYAAGRNSIMGDDELDNMIRVISHDRHREFVAFGRSK